MSMVDSDDDGEARVEIEARDDERETHDHVYCITPDGIAPDCPDYGDPGYYGRPVDDPDGESAAILAEQADDLAIDRRPPSLDDPRVFDSPAGARVTVGPEALPFRLVLRDDRSRELVVITVRPDGRLTASYDEQDLDTAAAAFLDALVAEAVRRASSAVPA